MARIHPLVMVNILYTNHRVILTAVLPFAYHKYFSNQESIGLVTCEDLLPNGQDTVAQGKSAQVCLIAISQVQFHISSRCFFIIPPHSLQVSLTSAPTNQYHKLWDTTFIILWMPSGADSWWWPACDAKHWSSTDMGMCGMSLLVFVFPRSGLLA